MRNFREVCHKKLRGRSRVPVVFYSTALSVSSCLFLLSSLVPWFLFSLPFFMDYATVFSCTLIECIESIKSDVKKKIMPASACDRHTKVTRQVKDEIFFRAATIIHPLHAKNSSGTHFSIAFHIINAASPRCARVEAQSS